MPILPAPATISRLPSIHYRSLSDIKEDRPVALITDAGAWSAVSDELKLDVVWQATPTGASIEQFESIAGEIAPEARIIFAVGGGLLVDAAKLCALRTGLPLVAVPTALSVDAHLTPASGFRKNGCVYYLPTPPPQTLFVDLEVIAAAPPWIRAAGICDVLSIGTGLWDWNFAEKAGKNSANQQWIPFVADIALEILTESVVIAGSAGRGERNGLARLLQLLVLEVQLCNLIGHSRPEEGSEHAFAYSVENLVGKGLPHGDLVGPGILAMAAAQNQEIKEMREVILASGVRLERIPAADAHATLKSLPDYARKHELPYGISHELDDKRIDAALRAVW